MTAGSPRRRDERQEIGAVGDFAVCPHCWNVNPASRFCARCLADMSLLLQESGGRRWTAAAQSPMPVRVGRRLSRRQRVILLGALILFGVGQVAVAFAPALLGPGARDAVHAP